MANSTCLPLSSDPFTAQQSFARVTDPIPELFSFVCAGDENAVCAYLQCHSLISANETKSLINEHFSVLGTPLHAAIIFGHFKIVELLLNCGANVDATSTEVICPIYTVLFVIIVVVVNMSNAAYNQIQGFSLKKYIYYLLFYIFIFISCTLLSHQFPSFVNS